MVMICAYKLTNKKGRPMSLKKIIASVAIFSFILISFMSSSNAKIVMSNDNNAQGLKGKTFEVLKKELEKRLKNEKIELHHSGALFDQKTQIEGLQLNSVQIISPGSGIYAKVVKELNALTLPFLLTSPEAIDKAMKDPIVRKSFVPQLQAKGIEPIAIWVNGPRQLSYRGSKPILLPSDMKGVKIRVQNIPSDIAAMKSVGANVIGMSWGEVPTALAQKVIDAVEPTPNATVGAGLVESIDYMTKIAYQYSFYIVGANKKWWDGLSASNKKSIQEALDVSTKWNFENAELENKKAYDKITSAGKKVIDLNSAQKAAWKKAMNPVWNEFGAPLVGKAAMDQLVKIGASN